jgi:hypothetical protein
LRDFLCKNYNIFIKYTFFYLPKLQRFCVLIISTLDNKKNDEEYNFD